MSWSLIVHVWTRHSFNVGAQEGSPKMTNPHENMSLLFNQGFMNPGFTCKGIDHLTCWFPLVPPERPQKVFTCNCGSLRGN